MSEFPSIPYPPIEKLGLIGDRRTAALVAADGTLCWMCLPNYDGASLFGSLLDSLRGGAWKLGPVARRLGRQRYIRHGPILQTTWQDPDYSLDLLDFMPWPHDQRRPADENRRIVVRRLHCRRGCAPCHLMLAPRDNFARSKKPLAQSQFTVVFEGMSPIGVWSSKPMTILADRIDSKFVLHAGEEVWCVLDAGEDKTDWTLEAAASALSVTMDYWNSWAEAIEIASPRRDAILRSAMLVHLLTFAPTGALVASPTTSLPERIGGDRNYDYRLTWIRDASLGLGLLAKLGLTKDAKRFLQWLAGLEFASSGRPLQVLYTIDGKRAAPPVEHPDIAGYRHSMPVRTGNAAVAMTEIDSYGYLTDCVLTYLQHGGEWEPEYWRLIKRLADYTAKHWQEAGSSIWELPRKRQYVASKIMSAVTLDRAAQIAEQTGQGSSDIAGWHTVRDEILAEIMSRGWSERLGAFRQHYDADSVDAAALLIPLMGLLPVEHPRIASTIVRLIEHLDVNGLLHRFVSSASVDGVPTTVGDEEGAFLMCSFWLAQVLAQRGEGDKAEAIVRRAEAIAGELGLFAEAADARANAFLGNTPLIFSQVEYARALLALDRTQNPVSKTTAAAS